MATLITKNSSTASAVPAAGDLVKGELAVNVTDKKVYTKDNSAAVVKLVGSLGNQEANAVAVTGGTINGTTIGATTPSTGAFTTASASSGFTGNLTGNVTGNVSGTAANVTGVVAIANGGTGLSALGTGVQSALGQAVTGSGSFVLSTSPSLTTPNLGTPSAAVLTNATGLPLTTGVTGTLGVANGGTGITAFGTGVATALGQNVTGSGGIVLATSPSLTTPNLGTPSAATLTNATGLPISTGVSGLGTGVATALGVATGSAGAFVVNGGALGTPSSGTLTNATGLPISTGVSGLGTGVATALAVNTGSAGAFVVNGGALGTPSSGTLTNATGLPLSTGVTGTLATTNGGTGLTSFTANGVVYASSSSALTTGSALVFDGTRLKAGGAPTANNYYIQSSGGVQATASVVAQGSLQGYSGAGLFMSYESTYGRIEAYDYGTSAFKDFALALNGGNVGIGTSSPGQKLEVYGTLRVRSATEILDISAPAGKIDLNNLAGDPISFSVGSSEGFRLTSTGLGIGTSSPAQKLQVHGAIYANNSTNVAFLMQGSQYNGSIANTSTANTYSLGYTTDASTHTSVLYWNASGNLGLGVTPSAWAGTGVKAFQFQNGSLAASNSFGTMLSWNSIYDGAYKYVTSSTAGMYQFGGSHSWHVAPSGTAGNTISFTQAMTLDASGQLSIGATSANSTLTVGNTDATATITSGGTNTHLNLRAMGSGGVLIFGAGGVSNGTPGTERARIDANGNLLVGGTTNTSMATVQISVGSTSTASSALQFLSTTSGSNGIYFGDGTSSTDRYRGYLEYNHASDFMVLATAATERARITSGGYSKFSNSGTYVNANANFHEIVQSEANTTAYFANLNATAANNYGINISFRNADPNGTGNHFIYCEANGSTQRMSVRSNGGIANYQSNNVDLSDARTKKEITPAPSYWDKIGALEIVTYKYNDQTHDDVNVGVIAQQVESVEPVWVDSDGWGEAPEDGIPLKTVYTKDITFAAIKTLQEAMARIEQLEAKVAALEAK